MKKILILALILVVPLALSAQSLSEAELLELFEQNNQQQQSQSSDELELLETLQGILENNPQYLPNENFGQVDPDTNLPFGIEEQVSVEILPSVPSPLEPVSITVQSYSTDLNKAVLAWSIDGEVVRTGRGVTQFVFTAPPSGSRSVVRVTIEKDGGGTIVKEYVFAPADVDVIWEARTYVPPFYKGKSLYTRQSTLVFAAVSNFVDPTSGAYLPPEELVYSWKVNGDVVPAASGLGRDSFELKGNIISRPLNIILTVTGVGNDLSAKKSITVVPFDPEVVLYENNPVYGIMFEKALAGSFMINRQEMKISAVPYHFSAEQRSTNDVQYRWYLNGRPIETFTNQEDLTFRKVDDSEGVADVSINTNHSSNILQASDTRFSIILENLESSDDPNPTSLENSFVPDNELEDFAF